jgi:photosystem II stability/assembly factor-like uncharacterized protein
MCDGFTRGARRWPGRAAFAATLLAGASAFPPAAVAEPWTSLGPPGGQVQSLAVTAGGTVVAGTAYGGVFRSDAGVNRWTAASLLDFPIPNPIALAPDPADRATVYAATGTLWKSGDGGRTWRQISVQPVIALSVCAASHLTFYAVGDHQVWRSDDGGATLRELAADLPRNYATIAVDPQDPETAYISTYGGVFKTTDGGANWASPGPLNETLETLLADPASPGTLYAEAVGAFNLLVTHDGAQTWTYLTADLPVHQCRQPGGACSLTALALSPPPRPGSPSILHVAFNFVSRQHSGQFLHTFESLLARSADGGVTWTAELDIVEVDTVNDHESDAITAIAVDPQRPQRMFAAVGSMGVMTTANSGGSWQLSNAGLIANVVTAVVQDPRTAGVLTLSSQGLGILASSDGGAAWKSADNGLGAATPASRLVADPARAGVLYAIGPYFLAKSRDFGASWQPLSIPIGTNDLAVDPHRPGTLAAVGYTQVDQCPTFHCPLLTFVAAALSSDGGNSWVSLQGSMGLVHAMGQFNAVRFDPLHPRTILVAGDLSFKTTDLGVTWERLPLGPGIADLAIDDHGPGHYYAADPLRNAVDVSADGGATWVSSPLPAGTLPRALALDPFRAGVIYLGGDGGVFVSRDSGRSWESLDDGLPHLPVLSLAVSTFQETVLYAGTAGRGLFSLTLR